MEIFFYTDITLQRGWHTYPINKTMQNMEGKEESIGLVQGYSVFSLFFSYLYASTNFNSAYL